MRIRGEGWGVIAMLGLWVGVVQAAVPLGAVPVLPHRRPGFRVARLGRLRARETLLRAELAIAKLQSAIAHERVSCGVASSPLGLVLLPEVRSVDGVAGHVRAVVQYPDGTRMTVETGSLLEDGTRVIRVERREVWVRTPTGQVRALGFMADGSRTSPGSAVPFIPAGLTGPGVPPATGRRPE